jgi:hypothetical protein
VAVRPGDVRHDQLPRAAFPAGAGAKSDTRFPQALAPIAIPLAVSIGLAIDRMLRARGASTSVAWLVAAMLYLPVLADLRRGEGLRLLVASFAPDRDAARQLEPGWTFTAASWSVALCLVALALVRSRVLVAALGAAAILLAGHNAGPLARELTPERSMKAICGEYAARGAGSSTLGLLGEPTPSLRYYTGKRLRLLPDAEGFFRFMAPDAPAYAIVEREDLVQVDREYRQRYPGQRLHLLYRDRGDWLLLSNRDPDSRR